MTLKFNEDGYPYEDLTAENKKLQNRPYAEVFQLIALIVGLKPVENSKNGSKEEKKN